MRASFSKCLPCCNFGTMTDRAQSAPPSFKAPSLQPSRVLIWLHHLWGSSELRPTGAELGFITVSLVLAQFSPLSISLCLPFLRYLAGMPPKWEPAARSSTSFHGCNLSFFTRDEAFYEMKWVSLKWSATKAPWLICLLGYCSCHLWKTSGQQID